ncbi:MAG: hypothetical protein ACE5OY_06185 [Candidatus Bathyarchaeia archaeon]
MDEMTDPLSRIAKALKNLISVIGRREEGACRYVVEEEVVRDGRCHDYGACLFKDLKISINKIEPDEGQRYPVTPEEVCRMLARFPREDLEGLRHVLLSPRTPVAQDLGLYGQYLEEEKGIRIYPLQVRGRYLVNRGRRGKHEIIERFTEEGIRSKTLWETLPHEIGHFVDHKRLGGRYESDERAAEEYAIAWRERRGRITVKTYSESVVIKPIE